MRVELNVSSIRLRISKCGTEALDMLQAMNTGHDGSLTTVHAGSPEQALRRIEMMVLMAGLELPHSAVHEHVRLAIDVVVHVARDGTGKRFVAGVAGCDRRDGGVRPLDLELLEQLRAGRCAAS
jgi:pilus assembly protein CpaF